MRPSLVRGRLGTFCRDASASVDDSVRLRPKPKPLVRMADNRRADLVELSPPDERRPIRGSSRVAGAVGGRETTSPSGEEGMRAKVEPLRPDAREENAEEGREAGRDEAIRGGELAPSGGETRLACPAGVVGGE